MRTPLDRFIQDLRTHRVGVEDLSVFLRGPQQILFISGDPHLKPETHDVAVVVRELTKGHPGLDLGWLAPEDEPDARKVLALRNIPCVILASYGREVRRIEGSRDWQVYAEALRSFTGRDEIFS